MRQQRRQRQGVTRNDKALRCAVMCAVAPFDGALCFPSLPIASFPLQRAHLSRKVGHLGAAAVAPAQAQWGSHPVFPGVHGF